MVSKKRSARRLKYIKSSSTTGVSEISSAWSKLVSFIHAVKNRHAQTIKTGRDTVFFINRNNSLIINAVYFRILLQVIPNLRKLIYSDVGRLHYFVSIIKKQSVHSCIFCPDNVSLKTVANHYASLWCG